MKKKKPNNVSSRQRDFIKALQRDLKKAKDAIDQIDKILFGKGAPVGSDNYWECRRICSAFLNSKGN